ncbi:MAG: hypothetical protein KUG82_09600 [Pseudomonadales bacterium]|nr:hypothetical protein [Pseudomonadales bacterium]
MAPRVPKALAVLMGQALGALGEGADSNISEFNRDIVRTELGWNHYDNTIERHSI